jgi:hypothetical protein
VVVDPSTRHGVQRPLDGGARLVVVELQQRLDVTGPRELGGAAETALGIDARNEFVAQSLT